MIKTILILGFLFISTLSFASKTIPPGIAHKHLDPPPCTMTVMVNNIPVKITGVNCQVAKAAAMKFTTGKGSLLFVEEEPETLFTDF